MCAGCCRYLIDHKISKIPLVGGFLVKKINVEKGGWIISILYKIYAKEILKCEADFIEATNDS